MSAPAEQPLNVPGTPTRTVEEWARQLRAAENSLQILLAHLSRDGATDLAVAQMVREEAHDLRALAAALPAIVADAGRYAWLAANPSRVVYDRGICIIQHDGDVRALVSFCSPSFGTLSEAVDYALSGAADYDVVAAIAAFEAAAREATP